jgi:hypothetical protein
MIYPTELRAQRGGDTDIRILEKFSLPMSMIGQSTDTFLGGGEGLQVFENIAQWRKHHLSMSTLISLRGTAASMIFNRFHPTFTMVAKHSHSVVVDVTERLQTPLLHDVTAASRAKNSAGSVMQNSCMKRRT